MQTRKINQIEKFRAPLAEFYRAWQEVENAILNLQAATERVRQVLSVIAPETAGDPKSWQVLDPLLHLEELTLEASRVVDEVKRAQGNKGKVQTQ